MHELALAEGILDVALAQAGPARRVVRIGLRVGALRQVVPSALEFSFALAAQGTPAEGAVLEMDRVPAVARCDRCGGESEQQGFPLHCTHCGALALTVCRGEELLIDWLDLESDVSPAAAPHAAGGASLARDAGRASGRP